MNRIKRILRQAKALPNQILMDEGFVLIKIGDGKISMVGNNEKMKIIVEVKLTEITKIEL